MYLIDSNIWLELLLKQEKSDDVADFLKNIQLEELNISDFTLYSIGIILSKLKEFDVLKRFLYDVISKGKITILNVNPTNLEAIIDIEQKYNLDFDDAYQYVVAEEYDLAIVSFDKNFDNMGY
ncbi:MAG: PIN domain-containing protein [Candidatus Cloacimonadota bacterium]|nr:PIN domain-containing protein [Candidatus Cloacimonadota bacterium]